MLRAGSGGTTTGFGEPDDRDDDGASAAGEASGRGGTTPGRGRDPARREGPEEEPSRATNPYEELPPLPRPWEQRLGLQRELPADRPAADEDPGPGWLPGPAARRVGRARTIARGTRERTVGGARLVREVAAGVRGEGERVAHDAEERARAAAQAVAGRHGRPTVAVVTGLVLAACTAVLVTSRAWDPTAGSRGVVAWAVGVVALGVAAGRPGATVPAAFRTMLVPAVVLVVLAPFSRAESPFAWALLAVPLMGAGGAVAIGLVAAGTRRAAELVPRSAPFLPRVALGIAALAAVLAAWGVRIDHRVIDRTPARPVPLSDRTGAFRGVAVGDGLRAVRARLGAPVVAGAGSSDAGRPLDAPKDFAGPEELPAGDTWRYDGLALVVSRSRVLAVVVTDRSAQTPPGVGIGDSIEVVRRTYGGLKCEGVRLGEATNPAYPACRSRLLGEPGRRRTGITFSGDPVGSVVLQRGATGPRLGAPAG